MSNRGKDSEDTKSKEKPGRMARLAELLKATCWAILYGFILLLIVVAVVMSWRELSGNRVVIQPFNVPPHLTRLGYSSNVVAGEILGRYNAVLSETRTMAKSKELGLSESDALPDIEVPDTQISLSMIIDWIGEALGRAPKRINGEIVGETNQL